MRDQLGMTSEFLFFVLILMFFVFYFLFLFLFFSLVLFLRNASSDKVVFISSLTKTKIVDIADVTRSFRKVENCRNELHFFNEVIILLKLVCIHV